MRICTSLMAVVVPLLMVASSYACSCAPHPPPKKALEQAAAVFSGTVLKIADAGEHSWAVTFAVTASWKGVEEKEVVVMTGKNDGICGYKFAKGKPYIVYANETVRDKVKHLATGICHRTAPLAEAAEDLKELGDGKKPK